MSGQLEPIQFQKVDFRDTEMMDLVYALRYQVYVEESGFLKADDYPNQRESDHYDQQSVHFVAMTASGEMAGALRMILPGKYPLPIQQYCPDVALGQVKNSPPISYSEISRLVICKRLRRRKDDGLYYGSRVEDTNGQDAYENQYLRRAKPMAFGLYREMFHESKRLGLTHWYMVMEKSLWKLLRIYGFTFSAIGEEVDVYGPVKPYIGKIEQIEKDVLKKAPQFYNYFFKSEYN